MTDETSLFHPRDGALLDLESLSSLASAVTAPIEAWLGATWPGAEGLVLEGLSPLGEPASGGPPGAIRPDAARAGLHVSPGAALIRVGDRSLLLRVEERFAPWPNAAGAAVRAALVLVPRRAPINHADGLLLARDRVWGEVGFARPDQLGQPGLIPLAVATGNGRDWATDIQRLWQPEHPAVRLLLKRFESLEQGIWQAEPEGAVWDRQVLGRNWVRYQTVAASALQAARMNLETHALSTLGRVRLLGALRRQLQASVERAATELLQLIGPPDAAGPYKAVYDDGVGG